MRPFFEMPIQTRTEILTTVCRGVLGIKSFRPRARRSTSCRATRKRTRAADLQTPRAFAERTVGGDFLRLHPPLTSNSAARVVNGFKSWLRDDLVESASAVKTLRPPLRARALPTPVTLAMHEIFAILDALKRVSCSPRPPAAQVPIDLLADLRYMTGPALLAQWRTKMGRFMFCGYPTSEFDACCARRRNSSGHHINIRPVTTTYGPATISISPCGQDCPHNRIPFTTADHFRAPLHEQRNLW